MVNYRRIKNIRERLKCANHMTANASGDMINFWDAIYWFWMDKITKEYNDA